MKKHFNNKGNIAVAVTFTAVITLLFTSFVYFSINGIKILTSPPNKDDSNIDLDVKTYEVDFKNYDDSLLYSTKVKDGDEVTYKGKTPSRVSDSEFIYTFKGWDKELGVIKSDTTLFAQYTSAANQHKVEFKNYDGTVLQTTLLAYGDTPVYNGETPLKPKDNDFSYAFKGWDKPVEPIKGPTEYIATYQNNLNKYSVIFKNYDGTILQENNVPYGMNIEYNGQTPLKESDEKFNYVFNGWDLPIEAITKDTVYTAVFTNDLKKFNVSFTNYDNSELYTTSVAYGEIATYKGTVPSKIKDEKISYVFSGWDKPLEAVISDIVYQATFTSEINKYSATFVNDDGTLLEHNLFEYETMPVYKGVTPLKIKDAQYSYTFSGWDKVITPIKENVTYKATYKESLNSYTITFKNFDGTILQSSTYEYGNLPVYKGIEPTKPNTTTNIFKFNGWNKEIANVTKEEVYTATFSSSKNEITYEYVSYEKAYKVIGGGANLTDVYISSTYNDGTNGEAPVTSIYWKAFEGQTLLKSVSIPNSVTTIGTSAFKGCSALKSVIVPDSVTLIDTLAFSNCTALNDVKLSNNLKTLGNSAFLGCSALTEISLPESLIDIKDDALKQTGLITAKIPSQITTLNAQVFCLCKSLETVILPENLITIGSLAFYQSGIKSMIIPKTVTAINDNAFGGCDNLYEITIPDSVTTIGQHCFSNLNLKTINIGENSNITKIGNEAFSYTKITSFTLPKKAINGMGDGIFRYCLKLKTVFFPNNYQTIGNKTFENCESLETINIPGGVEVMGDDLFAGCKNLVSVSILEEVERIGNRAFKGCQALQSLSLPTTLIHIFYNAFEGCSSIKSLNLPEGLLSIGEHAFDGTNLTKLVYGESLNYVANYGFANNVNLKTVIMNDNLKNTGYDAFNGCTSLTNVTLPANLNEIGASSFENCSSLATIIIPKTVRKIGARAFMGCPLMKSVILPEKVDELDYYSFDLDITKDIYSEARMMSVLWHNSLSYKVRFYSDTHPGNDKGDRVWRYVNGVPTSWAIV